MISRTRGYLPHFEIPEGTYFLTFRLADSLPTEVLIQLRTECKLSPMCRWYRAQSFNIEYRSKVESYLDTGRGECLLKEPKIARLVIDALLSLNGEKYILHAWTIMPNHVHVLFTMNNISDLSSVIQKWKGSSAFYANRVLQRRGTFWQPEYFDRLVRSPRQFEFFIRYIYNNPVKAGLCEKVFHWPWTGCSPDMQILLNRYFGFKEVQAD
jgi:REP element-mobilizing transposase RayT